MNGSRGLSPQQRSQFREQGYLIVNDLFTEDDLQPVIDEITQTIDRLADELVDAGALSQTYADLDFAHRLAAMTRETDQVAVSMWNGQLHGRAFFELIRHPKLLDVAESIVGPEIIASSVYRLRPKVPSHRKSPVPWHQDSGYFEPYCDKALVLTVWIPLVNATEQNGCLWVIPGAHHDKVVTHRRHPSRPYLVIPDAYLPAGEPVCCPVPRGGALLLHNLTPHASFENNTHAVRWSMDLRYQGADLPTNAPIDRLPGETVGRGEADDVPPACYPPEADFLVRSIARPQQVVTDASTFARIRERHLGGPVTQRWQPAAAGEVNE